MAIHVGGGLHVAAVTRLKDGDAGVAGRGADSSAQKLRVGVFTKHHHELPQANVLHGHIDLLAAAGAVSGVNGSHDANDDMETGNVVELFRGHHAGTGLAVAVDVHDAVHCL